MATFTKRLPGGGNQYDLVLTVTQSSQSVANNTSNVSWNLKINKLSGSGYWANDSSSWSVNIGGQQRSGTLSKYDFRGKSSITLGSGSVTIGHNSNGTKSISASGWWGGRGSIGGGTASGTMNLTTIPRESKITALSVASRTMTSITYSWKADKAVNAIRYRRSGGSWTTPSASGTSGSFTISGLSPGQGITAELQVRNRDSNLWSSLWARAGTTYREATTSSVPNFSVTPGGSVNLSLSFSREHSSVKPVVHLQYWGDNQQWNNLFVSGAFESSGTISLNSGHMNTLLNSRKTSKTITTRYVVYSRWSGTTHGNAKYSPQGTATIQSSAGPTLGNLSYHDSNSTIVNVTGNNKIILQNKSNLSIGLSAGNSRYGASITKITATSAGKSSTINLSGTSAGSRTFNLGTVNVGSNSSATVTIYDSRGFTASKSINYTVEAYQNPTLIALKPTRKFGYEEPSYVESTVRISKINGKNKPGFRYRIRPVGGTWGAYQTVNMGSSANWGSLWQYKANTYIADYPNDREYEVEGQVSDALTGWSNTTTAILPKGVPLMKFTQNRVDVGVPLHVEKGIHIKDNRGSMNSPSWYLTNRPSSLSAEFKSSSDTGLAGGWSAVYTTVLYIDTSVPQVFQIAYNQNGHQYKRVGEGNSWKGWTRLVDANGGYISGSFNMDGSVEANVNNGSSWINGKNRKGFIDYNHRPGGSYHNIVRAKADSGYWSMGTIFDNFGLYWYKNSTTENTKDGHVYMDASRSLLVSSFDLYLPGGKVQDYIIESGSTSSGRWRKWSNGDIEMWGKVFVPASGYEKAGTGGFGGWYSPTIRVNLPKSVTSKDDAVVTGSLDGQAYRSPWISTLYLSTTSVLELRISQLTSSTMGYTASWEVKGRWK